jgi:uncharacterized caspase-like protein
MNNCRPLAVLFCFLAMHFGARDGLLAAESPRNRAVIIGINDYYRVGKLKYCVADAKAVRDQLVRGGVFAPGDVVLMTDDASEPQNKPTLGNLQSRLENLHTFAKGADTLLVFFAGHGEMTGEGEQRHGVLIPIDGSKTRGIPLADIRAWLAKCEARNTLLILDACHAGEGERAVRTIAPTLAAGAGLVVLASCTEDQQSYDVLDESDPKKGHGVFSHFLVSGLAGDADLNGDLQVTLDELYAYVQKNVTKWAYSKNKQQAPVRLPKEKSGNLVLARVRQEVKPSDNGKQPDVSVPQGIIIKNGVLFDRERGLCWYLEPASKPTKFESAARIAKGMELLGGGWRLPTSQECLDFATRLQEKGLDTRNLGISGTFWTSSNDGPKRFVVDLQNRTSTRAYSFQEHRLISVCAIPESQ